MVGDGMVATFDVAKFIALNTSHYEEFLYWHDVLQNPPIDIGAMARPPMPMSIFCQWEVVLDPEA